MTATWGPEGCPPADAQHVMRALTTLYAAPLDDNDNIADDVRADVKAIIGAVENPWDATAWLTYFLAGIFKGSVEGPQLLRSLGITVAESAARWDGAS